MKKLLIFILFSVTFSAVSAQGEQPSKFSPKDFECQLKQFIIKEAGLTPQEASDFFPVYKEMQKKQRALYDRQRQIAKIKPVDEKGCEKAIREYDNIEIELKRVQQAYHLKFLDVLPASKVYDVIKAEYRFHRRMLKKMTHERHKKP